MYNKNLVYNIEIWLNSILGNVSEIEIYSHQYNIFSEVIKVKCLHDLNIQKIVIKRYNSERRFPKDLRSCIQNEYKILKYLHDRFSDLHGINVIRPIGILLESNILISEDFSGNKLNQLILNNARLIPSKLRTKSLSSYLYLAGKWLRYFQEFTKQEQSYSFNGSDYLEKIKNKLKSSVKYGLVEADHSRIYDFAADRIQKKSDLFLESVGSHGDFAPWNILATEDEIRVLDFDRFSYRSKYEDLTCFISALEGNKSILGVQSKTINFLLKSFWEGYGSQQIDLNVFNLYMLLSTLKNLNNIDLSRDSNTKIFDILYERYRKRCLINLYRKKILDGIECENFLTLKD
jgi:hypothetical protein